MEIQVPLILFTSFLAWSAGVFATQGVLLARGKLRGCQMAVLGCAFATLVIGGVAVLFHLKQPLHIFNGFGNPTSGITQELVAIVIMFVLMVVVFAYLRRNPDDKPVPAWAAVCVVIVSVALDCVMAHSYMMPSRPVWDSVAQVLSLVGASCLVGPATVEAIASAKGADDLGDLPRATKAASAVGAVLTVLYLVVMSFASGSFIDMGYYFDPTHPTRNMFDPSTVSPFASGAVAGTAVAIVAAILSFAGAAVAPRKSRTAAAVCAVVLGLVATIALRIVFYQLGYSAFNFYGL